MSDEDVCRVCEDEIDELELDKLRTGEPCELVKCDVCGCVVHEGCASVIPEDSTWCDNCQNQFDHAVSKD